MSFFPLLFLYMLYNIITFCQKGLESTGLRRDAHAKGTSPRGPGHCLQPGISELVWLGYHLAIFTQNAKDSSKKREVKNKTYTTSNIIRIDIINVI